jgi:hypothetical protein
VRLGDGCGKLRLGVLVGHGERVAVQVVGAGLVDLGKVRAALALLAHHRDDLIGGVRIIGVREHALLRVVADGVLMPADDVHRIAAHAQPRPGNQAAVDGLAHGHIGALGALGAHVALGGKAGHHVGLGLRRSHQHALGHGLLDRLQVLRAGMQEQVHMCVNQAGHQRGVAQIDHGRSRRMRDRRAHLADALAHNQHLAWRDDLARGDIQHTRGMKNSGLGDSRGILRQGRDGEEPAEQQKDGRSFHGASRIHAAAQPPHCSSALGP